MANRRSRTPTKSRNKRKSRPRGGSSSSSEPRGRKSPSERRTKSSLCNLNYPVARVKSMLKVHNHGLRVSDKSAVFTTAVLEYLSCEILELSQNAARNEGRSRIKPKHVNMAIKTDHELVRNFKNSSVPSSDFVPLTLRVNNRARALVEAAEPRVPIQGSSTADSSRSKQPDSRGASRRAG